MKTAAVTYLRGLAGPATKRWKYILLPGFIVVMLFFRYTEPVGHAILPPCLFHYFTGLHCPGCGAARALEALAHGDVIAAAGYNLLLTAFVAAGFVYLFLEQVQALSGRRLIPDERLKTRAAWLLVFIVILFGILRNIPIYPFTYLAP